MSLVVALSDSMLSAHKSFGTHLLQLQDQGESFQGCLCIASGCSLMQPDDLRRQDPESAVSIALSALESGNPLIKRHLVDDPPVRVVVVNSRSSIPYCRKTGQEEFPHFVCHRKRSALVSKLETPWNMCDMDDVVTQREERRRFDVLESCRLRNEKGMFSETDYYHLRRDVGKRAVVEIIKAMRRTALSRERDEERFKDRGIVLVLAAGWNVDDYTYARLDSFGKAWLRADIVASAELCALNGHPVSAFMKKLRDLTGRRRGSHWRFLKQSIASMKPVRLPVDFKQQMVRKRTMSTPSSLVGFVGAKRRKRDDTQSFPFAGKYVGNWYGMDQEVVIYPDWTYTVPGYVDYGRVTKSNVPVAATYCFRRSDKSGGKAHYFRFTSLHAYGAYELSEMPTEGRALWTLMKAEA